MSEATIAVVGGGFCGTLAAIRLLSDRLRGGAALPVRSRIALVDPALPGRGLADQAEAARRVK